MPAVLNDIPPHLHNLVQAMMNAIEQHDMAHMREESSAGSDSDPEGALRKFHKPHSKRSDVARCRRRNGRRGQDATGRGQNCAITGLPLTFRCHRRSKLLALARPAQDLSKTRALRMSLRKAPARGPPLRRQRLSLARAPSTRRNLLPTSSLGPESGSRRLVPTDPNPLP